MDAYNRCQELDVDSVVVENGRVHSKIQALAAVPLGSWNKGKVANRTKTSELFQDSPIHIIEALNLNDAVVYLKQNASKDFSNQ